MKKFIICALVHWQSLDSSEAYAALGGLVEWSAS